MPRKSPARHERYLRMLELQKAGLSYKEIGEAVGMSRANAWNELNYFRIWVEKDRERDRKRKVGVEPPPGEPRKCKLPETVWEVDRRVECLHYEACLTYAARLHWQGFACSGCGKFEYDKNGAWATEADMHGFEAELAQAAWMYGI